MNKESAYNFVFPYSEDSDNEYVLYNSRTTALAVLDQEHYKAFMDFCKNGKPIEDKTFRTKLMDNGYLIKEDVDEKQILKLAANQTRFNTAYLTMTIAPTLNCNFRCIYCYEKNAIKDKYMSTEVIEALIKLVESKANSLNYLHITWYGGEPLLGLDAIERLSKEFIAICNKHNITYEAIMITNGYLLTQEIAKRLSSCKISGIQITLDGSKEIHDKRRVLVGGQDTYDKIIQNIVACAQYIGHYSIRINTDNENLDGVNDVVRTISSKGVKNIGYYLGFVNNANNVYSSDKCMTVENFSKKHYDFRIENGLNPMDDYPLQKTNYCNGDFNNNYLVDPDGYLYTCWNDIGIENLRVGSILDNDILKYNFAYKMKYLLYDPTSDKKCSDCKFLPICMGGCPSKRINSEDNCCDKKYILKEYLMACTKYLLEKQTKATIYSNKS